MFVVPGFLRPIAAALAVAFLFGAAPVGAAAAGAAAGTLVINVSDTRAHSLSGAYVTASGAGSTQSMTTPAGGVLSMDLPPGLYRVIVSMGGFASSESDDVTVLAGTTTNVSVVLADASLSTLRVIGRTQVGAARFNTSSASVAVVGPKTIEAREPINLNALVHELPGVSLQRSFSVTPNSSFVVRGAAVEAKVEIDGHPISSGTTGEWNSNYANALTFESVELSKGAGINGATAGESVFGTLNLLTPDYAPADTAKLMVGTDNYNSGLYRFLLKKNFAGGRLQMVLQKVFTSQNGPNNGLLAGRADNANSALIDFASDFSSRFGLASEIGKLRYRFSNATSLAVGFTGFQGSYRPQAGAYGTDVGSETIPLCVTGGVSQFAASGCTPGSVWTAPYAQSQAGSTTELYRWFPNSRVENNEPIFMAEFRTAIKNNSLLIRPYAGVINRFIDGSQETQMPGNNGGWYQITNGANCQAQFVNPGVVPVNPATNKTITGAPPNPSALGPCYQGTNISNYQTYAQASTSAATPCSVSNPCWTTPTAVSNSGTVAFGTPFSQNELDRLKGNTLTFLHPVGQNLYGFSWDYNEDTTAFYSNDPSPLSPSCPGFFVSTTPANPAALPGSPGAGCLAKVNPATGLLVSSNPQSRFGTPPTTERRNDFALTGLLQTTRQLQIAAGAYYSTWSLDAQIEDPAVLAVTGSQSPVALVPRSRTLGHFDPHLGFTYRVNPAVILRGTAGSGITWPVPGNVSGLAAFSLPNAAQPYLQVSDKNPNLQPETTVAYDLGTDILFPGAGTLSMDAFDNTIHNVFVTNLIPFTGTLPPGLQLGSLPPQESQPLNAGVEYNRGFELQLQKAPASEWGYRADLTLQRAYLDQLPNSLFDNGTRSTLIDLKQLDGSPIVVPYATSYAEVNFTGQHDFYWSLGADYTSANNDIYGPAFTIFNSTLQLGITPGFTLQFAGDNIFNYASCTRIAQACANIGFAQETFGQNGTAPQGMPPTPLTPGQFTNNLIRAPVQSFRVSLEKTLP
jgi:hypothetical protein